MKNTDPLFCLVTENGGAVKPAGDWGGGSAGQAPNGRLPAPVPGISSPGTAARLSPGKHFHEVRESRGERA